MICFDFAISASLSSRGSGTATSPTLGSIVQKGKFAACAAAVRVSALNSVDLPTFGRPTIPTLKPMDFLVSCLVRNCCWLCGKGLHGQVPGRSRPSTRWQAFCPTVTGEHVMEAQMETELATWHFVVAGILFVVLGTLAHIIRAVFNVFPDKLSDTPAVNVLVSSDYSWGDYLIGTEFDDAGYYRLDSLKNLRLSVTYWLIAGFGVMLFSAEAAQLIAYGIEAGITGFVDLFWQRIEDLKA
jgi:hypothetical protein